MSFTHIAYIYMISIAASIMLLAKMSNLSGAEHRGACRRCNMVGHLTFQCRNPVAATVAQGVDSSSDSDSDTSSSSVEASAVASEKEKKGKNQENNALVSE